VYGRIRTSASEEGVRDGAGDYVQDSKIFRFKQANKASGYWQVQPKKTQRAQQIQELCGKVVNNPNQAHPALTGSS
jgi:hypothetical protein